jgi:glycosyltransferase involved in cell wall biosynthesis
MRIAFYAPLKSPDHPTPSGDRRMARLLVTALEAAGHVVDIPCRLRAYDGMGDLARQSAIKSDGERQVMGLLDAYADDLRPRPDIWFTYHLFYKAPDWIGPRISETLGIPYVVAEASHAPKRTGGAWDLGHRATQNAITMASLIIGFNERDAACVRDLADSQARIITIPPFIDTMPYTAAAAERQTYRSMVAGQYDVSPGKPWLLTVAMMRTGDKLASYRQLGEALAALKERPWHLFVAGDGSAKDEVRMALAPVGERITWLGAQENEVLPGIYAASDLYVWPSVREAYGMAFIEAQAAGVPVIGARVGGVPGVVRAPDTGILVEPDDVKAFTVAITSLLDDDTARVSMGQLAQEYATSHHGLKQASRTLGDLLRDVVL